MKTVASLREPDMTRPLLTVLLAAFCCLGWSSAAVAQPSRRAPARARPAPPTGTAALQGRVTAADTGGPLRQVDVSLSSSTSPIRRQARTDPSGQYRFDQLPAGRYWLRAGKPGFVPLRYGVADPLEPGRPVDLADGGVARADFVLPRAGVINGRVVDEFGEPVLDADVRALRYQSRMGQRRLTSASRVHKTDDRGAFRVFGLLPGTYYVAVTPRWSDPVTDEAERSEYAPSYYPGTADLSRATAVRVALGAEVSSIDVVLEAVRTSKVTGSVLDALGAPAAGAQITVIKREQGNTFIAIADTRARADGTFELSQLPPGAYSVQAWLRGIATAPPEFGASPLQVAGENLDGFVVRTATGGTLAGRVLLRPDARTRPVPFRPSLIEVAGTPAAEDVRLPAGSASTTRVRDDWTFELRAMSGQRRVRVSGVPSPWALETITLDGRDITDEAVSLQPGTTTRDAEIVLTTLTTEIDGSVDAGQAAAPVTVLVYPSDRAQRDPLGRRVLIRRVDRDRRFRMRGLPPGDYLAIAVPYVWQGEWLDPEFFDKLDPAATRVQLATGTRTALSLKVAALPQ